MLHKLENRAEVEHSSVGMKLWLGGVGLSIAVGLAYFLAAQLGLALLTTAERVAVFWPASGIAVGILIALGGWARGPVAAGVIAATLAANLMADRSVWSALAFGLCNTAEALLAMWLIERWFGHAFNLDNLRRVLGFFAAAGMAAATAALGASGAMTLFGPSTAAFLDVWEVWFPSDALGIITVAPLLIGGAAAVRERPSWRELLEGTLAVAAVTATIGFLLVLLSGPWEVVGPGAFLFPLLLWLGYRCRPVFAAAAVFTIAAAIVWTTTHEFGRYGDATQPIASRVIAAQISMLGATFAALALAALFAERRRSEAALRESDTRLRSILDAANVIAWDVDLTSNTVHSAGPVARLLHRPVGSVPGDFAAMVGTIHPGDRDSVMAQFWAAVSTAAAYRLKFRLNSEGLRWVTAEGSIERDAHGRPVRVRGITQDITERKKAEEQLRKSESDTRELLRALAERNTQFALAENSALVGSFAYDVDTDMLQISDGYAAIHGFPNETKEIPRSRWLAGVHPEDRARVDELRSRAFRTRSPEYGVDFRIARSGGEVRWIEARAFVVYRDDGRPQRVAGVNIDVTERKRAEAALEESRARYRALYDDNPSMYFTVDAVGTVLSVNEFGARQLGYRPAELVGRSVLEVVHEGDREGARRWLASCAQNADTIATTEMRKVRRDGSTMWVRKVARALQGFGGQALVVVCEDITERKEAESALAEREAQLALAGRAARVSSFVVDYATLLIQASPGFAATHGLAEEAQELTCEEWQAHLHPDDLARFEAQRSRVFAEQRRELNMEYRIVGADGKARWIESRGLVSYDGDGRPVRLVGVHIDITERKQAEERLQDSERKVRELLGALPAAIYVTDAVGHIIYYNQSAVDLWGTEPLLGKDKWSDLVKFYHADGSPMALEDCPTEVALKHGRIARGQEAIVERRDGTHIPVIPYPTPLRDETGTIVGVVNMKVDISERRKVELALAERNIQLALAGRAALVGSWAYDADTEIMRISEGYAAIHGFPEGTVEIPRNECLATVHSDDIGRLRQFRSESFSEHRREYSVEYRIIRPDGEMRWVETRCFISYDGERRPHRVVGVSIDITERKRAEEQQGKLVAELDHRVKNVLATVQAVAAQTMQASSSMEQFVAALDGRIQSMGSTHELLSHRRWLGIPLAELVERELAPYATGSNAEIAGPEVMLSAAAAQTMGMVLHELVTNAAKYGALSTRDGRVSVRWYPLLNGDADARLCIEWQETDGPPVQASERSGYGMEVIRRLLPYELEGEVDLAFATEGVRCRFRVPHSRLTGRIRRADTYEDGLPQPVGDCTARLAGEDHNNARAPAVARAYLIVRSQPVCRRIDASLVWMWRWITGCRRSMARSKSGVDLTLFLLRSRTGSLPVRLLRGIGDTPRRRSDPTETWGTPHVSSRAPIVAPERPAS